MQFNSIEFLFCFLPAFLAVYYICPERWRNAALSLGSLIFLAFNCEGNFWWLGLVASLTLFTYLAGEGIHNGRRRGLLALAIVVLVSVLGLFRIVNGGVLLPLGLSFYSLQMASYLIDVYRGRIPVEHGLVRYSAQILMFPKLFSGPLMPPKELQRQAWGRGYLPREFSRGVEELIFGLALKVLLADRLGGLWNQAAVIGYESISTPFAWMALIAYAMRLYFDFWGYSLMAMGIGRMLGFELPENFCAPYAAKTVSDFYRRWHITLGAWFREYVYIPLGGSRCGMLRTVLNLAVVWLVTALWHGTGLNYLIWAGILFLLIVNEKLWLGKLMNRSHVVCHVYVVAAILLSWLPFAVGDFSQIICYLGRLFSFSGAALNPTDFLIWGGRYGLLLLAGAAMTTPLPVWSWHRIRGRKGTAVFLFVLFWAVIYMIATSSQDPFVYFQY